MKQAGASCSIARGDDLPRGSDERYIIFEGYFDQLCDLYDEKWVATRGMFGLDRIRNTGERFLRFADCRVGVVPIRCT